MGLPKLVSLPKGFKYLTSLRDLHIEDCNQLGSSGDKDDDDMPWQGFRSLQSLKIDGLPKLVSLPKGLQYVTTLRDLYIEDCNQIGSSGDKDDDDMPWQGFRSVQSLDIIGLPKLVSLPKGFQYLTSLQKLTILGCDQLESLNSEDDDDMPWQGFRSLQCLKIYRLPKLVSLPKGLQYFTTLRDLTIGYCRNLTALPEWISNSSSLSKLQIKGCPKLSKRCRNNMGMDWSKIAHIPNIQIDYKWIQEDGCYQYSSSTG
ncbi:hypothetical protein Pint_26222 [Pistacia integerrima]|uniref:Uncharacterized protein n=1 Tax=Pistacia integerrima TaxID=434235 RepID=A0ACC0YFG8_9ROSI|nr:hypothetical protein Pint_26222 [Pistacia integerrima]